MKKLFIVFFVFVSCSESITPTYNFPKEIAPYVEKFLLEGKKRGVEIDLKGLKIYFKDSLTLLVNNYRPQAYYVPSEHAIYFEKGKRFYLLPEELVCHELGHALLKRDHLFDKLPNGDFKSVMGSMDVAWSKHPEKEKYYYDELFDKSQFNTLK